MLKDEIEIEKNINQKKKERKKDTTIVNNVM